MEKLLLVVFVVNVALSAIKGALDKLVLKFPSLATADSVLGTIVSIVSKLVDVASANTSHGAVEELKAAKLMESEKK